jgi:Lar family restriction alleviation protein
MGQWRRIEMTEELKSCPFCGGADATIGTEKKGKKHPWLRSYVHCKVCSANMYGFQTEDQAIAAWNRRAPSPAIEKAREALQGHLNRDPLCASAKTADVVREALALLEVE